MRLLTSEVSRFTSRPARVKLQTSFEGPAYVDEAFLIKLELQSEEDIPIDVQLDAAVRSRSGHNCRQ